MVTPPGWANKIATFQRNVGGRGVGGSVTYEWQNIAGLVRVSVEYKAERGSDKVNAGRLESSLGGVLRVYGCDAVRELASGDTVVMHDIGKDTVHNIKTISNPDNTGHQYELVVETGVSRG
jgi:head-tail adaptor